MWRATFTLTKLLQHIRWFTNPTPDPGLLVSDLSCYSELIPPYFRIDADFLGEFYHPSSPSI